MNPYSVKISPEIRSQLKQAAAVENITSHAMAKMAIEEFLKAKNPKAA